MRVTLVERRSAFGPGTAYDPGNADHLLNVRLDSMSAFPDESAHLSEWLARQASWQASGEFITRGTYGAYLRTLLDKALADNPRRLNLVQGRVTGVARSTRRSTASSEPSWTGLASDTATPPKPRLRGCRCQWVREQDLNLRPSGYEPDELPGCSIPRQTAGNRKEERFEKLCVW